MKKTFYLILLATFFASGILANPADSRKMIRLKVKKKMVHRSIQYSPVDAFINGPLLEIRFNSPFNEAIISVSNSVTGEEIYTEENKSNQVSTIYIGDYSENQEYLLNIEIDKDTFINGEFSTE